MTGARSHLLKEIEERLSKCTVDKNQLSAAHMFISDCIRNISDDNILTEADLGQWEILNAEKTSGVTCEETPVYLCNDAAVIEMEIKLMEEERDEKFLEVYEEVEWYLSEELKELNTILNQLEEKTLESQKSYELALNKYEEDSENVFVANLRVIDDLKNFDETVMKGQYLCESPLTTLKEKFDCFLESFSFHLTNHFLEAAKIHGGERCRNITAELRILEEGTSALLYENCILECLLKGQKAAHSHIMAMTDSNEKGVTSSLKTSIHDEVATLKNTETVQDIILGFKNDLISLSHLFTNVKKLKQILTMCNSKYNRVNYWLLQTEKWTNCIKEENKLITDILHVLNFEKEEASKVLCFFKDLETCLKREHDAAVCRTAFIQTQLQNPIENSILHSVLVNILGHFSIDKSISTKLLWKQLEEALIRIKKSNVWKQNNFLRSLKYQRCILFENEYLFKLISGLRKEPVLNYSQILLNIPTYLQKLDDSEKALCAINQDFIEKQNTLSKNYFMKHRRLLWVYILCDEDKLTEVLSCANEYLSNV